MKNNLKIFCCKYSLSDTVSEILQAEIRGKIPLLLFKVLSMTPNATKVKIKRKRRTFHNIERPILV